MVDPNWIPEAPPGYVWVSNTAYKTEFERLASVSKSANIPVDGLITLFFKGHTWGVFAEQTYSSRVQSFHRQVAEAVHGLDEIFNNNPDFEP